jgi:hypothetical protein
MATKDESYPVDNMKSLGPVWYATRTRFQVILTDMVPPGRLGRFRRWLVLKLWPQLGGPQVVMGVMEYTPVRQAD